MSSVRVIFPDTDAHWLLVEDGAIVARGDHAGTLQTLDGETRLLVAPARDVTLHTLDLPGLAQAQARAAAQLALAEKSLLPADQLHIACGAQAENSPTRPVALVSRSQMQAWIDGFDPDVIMPSPLLLPQPDVGYVRAAFGDEVVLRGADLGFAEDEVLTPLITGNAPVITLDRDALEAALIAAVATPPINLREGEFARRRQWRLDPHWVKRTAWIAAALLVVTLLIPLTQIARLSWGSATLEETSASLAQAALGEAVAPEAAVSALDARLTALRGGGAGFTKTAAAASRAIEATANVELTAMTFDPNGTLRLTLRATSADEIATVQARMRAAGLDVTSGAINPSQGQPIVETQVRGR
jgi:general secretion pathway protein L